MHELYNLKEMLVEELARYGEHDDLSIATLEIIDKLAHSAKNVGKVIECYEEQSYSKRGYSDRDMRDGGMSHRRGRAMNGRFVSRDGSSMVRHLREMAEETSDEQIRDEIERLASKIEGMK